MLTPRDVMERYAGGEYVDGTELRAAVAWMLSAWDEVMAAAGDMCAMPDCGAREDAVNGLLWQLLHWNCEIKDYEIDVSCAVAVPALLARRPRTERLPFPRPAAT